LCKEGERRQGNVKNDRSENYAVNPYHH